MKRAIRPIKQLVEPVKLCPELLGPFLGLRYTAFPSCFQERKKEKNHNASDRFGKMFFETTHVRSEFGWAGTFLFQFKISIL